GGVAARGRGGDLQSTAAGAGRGPGVRVRVRVVDGEARGAPAGPAGEWARRRGGARADRGAARAAPAAAILAEPAADGRDDRGDDGRQTRSGRGVHGGAGDRAAAQLSGSEDAARPDRRARAGGVDDGRDSAGGGRVHGDPEGIGDARGDGEGGGRGGAGGGGPAFPGLAGTGRAAAEPGVRPRLVLFPRASRPGGGGPRVRNRARADGAGGGAGADDDGVSGESADARDVPHRGPGRDRAARSSAVRDSVPVHGVGGDDGSGGGDRGAAAVIHEAALSV